MTAVVASEKLRPQITISDHDLALLERCVQRALNVRASEEAEALEAELSRARVVGVSEVPPDVVTMGSTIVVEDASGVRRTITLVFPEDADAAAGRISVLAPIGAAVIGLQVGAQIEWALPNGRATRLRVVEIAQQAAGDGR